MLNKLLNKIKGQKTLNDYKNETIQKLGRQQIKKLVDRGIELPVVLL